MNKKIILPAFIIVMILQIGLLLQMVIRTEYHLATHETIEIETGLYDPVHPLKGRYLLLGFDITRIKTDLYKGKKPIKEIVSGENGDLLYAVIESKEKYRWQVASLSDEKPSEGLFLQCRLRHPQYEKMNYVTVDYGFENYFIEEDLAIKADRILRRKLAEKLILELSLNKKNGQAIIKDFRADYRDIESFIRYYDESDDINE